MEKKKKENHQESTWLPHKNNEEPKQQLQNETCPHSPQKAQGVGVKLLNQTEKRTREGKKLIVL